MLVVATISGAYTDPVGSDTVGSDTIGSLIIVGLPYLYNWGSDAGWRICNCNHECC